ncbi:MAG: hypothetical protein IT326_04685 [Anaerolineae bacterium]|nr:hypothetical protein [Anaerolineae bacterium]
MDFLVQAHQFMARAAAIFTALVTLLALFTMIRRQDIGGDFWGAVIIGEIMLALQCLVGIAMLFTGLMPARWLHFLYGLVAIMTWPAVFAFTKGQTSSREATIWAVSSAFLFFIVQRVATTALPLTF